MHIEEGQLLNFIIDSGLASRSDVEKAKDEAKKSGKTVAHVLVDSGKLTSDEMRRMQAYVLGIPFVDLKNQKLNIDVLSKIPEPIARNHNVVAFKMTADTLEVAMLDTEDLSAIDFIKKKTGLRILPRLTDDASIKAALLQYQKSLKAEFGDIIQKEIGSIKQSPINRATEDQNLPKI